MLDGWYLLDGFCALVHKNNQVKGAKNNVSLNLLLIL